MSPSSKGIASQMPHDEAMGLAIGGGFAAIGPIEARLLRSFGPATDGYLIDVGCGSGRDVIAPPGNLGQALCVLGKPGA